MCRDAVSETVEDVPRGYDMIYGWYGSTRYASRVGQNLSFVRHWNRIQLLPSFVYYAQAISVRNANNYF